MRSPRPYQKEAIAAVMRDFNAYTAVLLEMATGLGKSQPLDAKILTPNGWVRMGDVCVGDLVIGEDGKPYPITGIFPQGVRQTYRISFSDGTSTRCCAEHLWNVQTKSQKSRGSGYKTLQTSDLIGDLKDGSGASKWFIPIVAPVEFESSPVPIDPYALGALLGNGGLTRTPMFSTADKFVLEEMKKRMSNCSFVWRGRYDYNIATKDRKVTGRNGSELTRHLKSLGLRGLKSVSKFIPKLYLYNDINTRIELLRGLMDTDGTINKDNRHIEFNTSSKQLAIDVCELVRSLGGCTRVRVKPPSSYTYKGEKLLSKYESYRICVSLESLNPFKLPRKHDLVQFDRNQGRTKAIVSIEPDTEEVCQCISVGSSSGLYVTDDYIVTHNTACFSWIASLFPGRVLVIAHRTELINQARASLQETNPNDFVEVEQAESRATVSKGSIHGGRIVVASKDTLSKTKRLNRFPTDEFDLLIVDEAHRCVKKNNTYWAIVERFAAPPVGRGTAKVLFVTATPKRHDGEALGGIVQKVSYTRNISQGIDDGFLVPVFAQSVKIDSIDHDLIGAKTTRNDLGEKDFSTNDLSRLAKNHNYTLQLIDPLYSFATNFGAKKSGVVFMPSVDAAKNGAALMNQKFGSGTAVAIVQDMGAERQKALRDFQDKKIQFLFNCDILTEGWDSDQVDIVVPRPTLSEGKFAQMVGRGTRPRKGCVDIWDKPELRRMAIANSPKPHLTVFDIAGVSKQLKLVSTADIFHGTYSPAQIQIAKEIMQATKKPVDEALKEARKKETEELAKRLKSLKTSVNYRLTPQELYTFFGMKPQGDWEPPNIRGKLATPKMVQFIESRGVKVKSGLSLFKARQIITEIRKKEENAPASDAQRRVLIKNGLDPDISKTEATKIIDKIQKNGWQLPEEMKQGEK